MGPGSFIWEGFVDPDLKTSTYSIELSRPNVYGGSLGSDAPATNITFGSANDAAYAGKDSVYMTSNSDYNYALESFGFGLVYQTDGADTSEYFYDLGNTYPASFSTNFKGLGLPANLYSQFVTLLEYITGGDVECDNTVDGICVLPAACENYTALTDFSFKVNFTGATDDNYIRVPLAIFAYNKLVTLGAQRCNIDVNYLNSAMT
jgi:hypothetical protein